MFKFQYFFSTLSGGLIEEQREREGLRLAQDVQGEHLLYNYQSASIQNYQIHGRTKYRGSVKTNLNYLLLEPQEILELCNTSVDILLWQLGCQELVHLRLVASS